MDAFVTRTVAEEGALRRGSTSLDTNGCFNQSEAALYRHVRGHGSQHAEFRFAPFPALRGQWRRVLRGQPSVAMPSLHEDSDHEHSRASSYRLQQGCARLAIGNLRREIGREHV